MKKFKSVSVRVILLVCCTLALFGCKWLTMDPDEESGTCTFLIRNHSDRDIYALVHIVYFNHGFPFEPSDTTYRFVHFLHEPIKAKGVSRAYEVLRENLKDSFKKNLIDSLRIVVFADKDNMNLYENNSEQATVDTIFSFTEDNVPKDLYYLEVSYP